MLIIPVFIVIQLVIKRAEKRIWNTKPQPKSRLSFKQISARGSQMSNGNSINSLVKRASFPPFPHSKLYKIIIPRGLSLLAGFYVPRISEQNNKELLF